MNLVAPTKRRPAGHAMLLVALGVSTVFVGSGGCARTSSGTGQDADGSTSDDVTDAGMDSETGGSTSGDTGDTGCTEDEVFLGPNPCAEACNSQLPASCGQPGNLLDRPQVRYGGRWIQEFVWELDGYTATETCSVVSLIDAAGQFGTGALFDCTSSANGAFQRELTWTFPDIVAQPFHIGQNVTAIFEFYEFNVREYPRAAFVDTDTGALLLAVEAGYPNVHGDAQYLTQFGDLEVLEHTPCEYWNDELCENPYCLTVSGPSDCSHRWWSLNFAYSGVSTSIWHGTSAEVGPIHVVASRAEGSDLSFGGLDAIQDYIEWWAIRTQ